MDRKLFILILISTVSCAYGMEQSLEKWGGQWFRSVKSGKIDDIKWFLKEAERDGVLNELVNVFCSKYNHTALHIASMNGNTALVELLLNHGALIDLKTKDAAEPTSLFIAVNFCQVIDLLVEKGADPLLKLGKPPYCNALDAQYVRPQIINGRDNYFKKQFEKLWPKVQLLWLGKLKEKPKDCKFATLPTELICMISDYVWGNKKLEYKKWKEGSAKYRKQLKKSEAVKD